MYNNVGILIFSAGRWEDFVNSVICVRLYLCILYTVCKHSLHIPSGEKTAIHYRSTV